MLFFRNKQFCKCPMVSSTSSAHIVNLDRLWCQAIKNESRGRSRQRWGRGDNVGKNRKWGQRVRLLADSYQMRGDMSVLHGCIHQQPCLELVDLVGKRGDLSHTASLTLITRLLPVTSGDCLRRFHTITNYTTGIDVSVRCEGVCHVIMCDVTCCVCVGGRLIGVD